MIATQTHKVLLVDDEASVQKICSLYLEAEGFAVKALSEANNVLDEVSSEKPDVIIMDLNLPGLDGFSATRLLKDQAETSHIPVLIISARGDTSDKQTALLSCSADDYLTKPFDPDELVARVTVLCRRKDKDISFSLLDYLGEQVIDMRSRVTQTLLQAPGLDDYIIEMIDRDFRKPLDVINRIARRLAGSSPAQPEIGTLVDEAAHLQQLVDRLVELRRFREGEAPAANSFIKLGPLVKPVISHFEELAEEKQVNFECNCPEQSRRIRTDPDRLRRTLSLLIQKAMNGNGASKVALQVIPRNGNVEFSISTDSEYLKTESESTNPSDGDSDNISMRMEMPLARHLTTLLGGVLEEETGGAGDKLFNLVIPVEPVKKGA